MSEKLSVLGKVVLIQTCYDLGDEETFEGDSGWMLSDPTSGTIWFVSKETGKIRVGRHPDWEDVKVDDI